MELLPKVCWVLSRRFQDHHTPGVAASVYNARFIKVQNKSFTYFNWYNMIQLIGINLNSQQSFSASTEGHHFMTSGERKRKHLRPWAEGRTESSMYAKPLRRHARPAKIQLRLADGPESDQLQHWCWVLSGQICSYDTMARSKIVFYYFFTWTPTCCFSEAKKEHLSVHLISSQLLHYNATILQAHAIITNPSEKNLIKVYICNISI